jgi:hypothetical protein
MATKAQITLTERALFARLSRALSKEGKALRRCRQDTRNHNELGDVYCVNTEKNLVEAKHIDIVKWAREMKILKAWEKVEA